MRWQYLCFYLLSLDFISDSVGSKDHQQSVHYRKDFTESKKRRTDQMPTPCVHDEIAERNPHIVDLASQNVYMGEEKRQISPTYANIRIHPEFVTIHSSVDPYVRGPNSILSQAIKTLESVLMVHPVQGNLRIPPNCTEHTFGVNKGKCRSPLPSQSDFDCGEFGTIPLSYFGVREVCISSYRSYTCTTQGPNGVGLPNTDYLLFVSASSTTSYCSRSALAHASYCVLDSSDNNRPMVGHINICPSLIDSSFDIYSTILHEIIHALGFSIRLFKYYVGVSSNPGRIRTGPYGRYGIFKGPKAVRVAESYYSCENIEGVALENEGTSNVATSHWEKRTLNNELMNGYISSDYVIFSEFTLALLEDSGWYKGNYTALSALNQRPLEWGKGLGCSFLNERCVDKSVYPYLCDTRSVCTFDHLSKGTCYSRKAGFDDCSVAVADEPEDYCRTDMNITLKRDVESYGSNSICVDTIQSSSSCGTDKSILPLCVTHESFTINGRNQYVVYLGDDRYHCEDNVTLVTADNWMISCPPTEDIVSRSPVIKTELPDLSPANKIAGPQDRTCLSELYPFGRNHDDFTLPYLYEGDRSSPPIMLAQAVQIFNQTYRKVYINDNGVISFGSPYTISTPLSFPLSGTDKIIAPYWADVGQGNIYYRQTTNSTLLTRANSEIRAAFPASQNVKIQNLLIATWYRVGYYESYDKTNTFQCVIATSAVGSFVIFLYADGQIEWTTGDRSGGIDGLYGTEALAGINAGDGVTFITLPGSLTSGIINIAQTSNVGILGTWMFNFTRTVGSITSESDNTAAIISATVTGVIVIIAVIVLIIGTVFFYLYRKGKKREKPRKDGTD